MWLRGVACQKEREHQMAWLTCLLFSLCDGETVQVKECVWLRDVACQKEREHRMAQLLWWLVVCFTFAVIRVSLCLHFCSLFNVSLHIWRGRG